VNPGANSLSAIVILECARRIEEYTSQGKDAFLGSRIAQDAVLRNLGVITEAAKRLSPSALWREVAGLWDVPIAGRPGVNMAEVWSITQNDVPVLKGHVAATLD
jgi:uncharacterized protein with HEPN domain